MGNEKTKRDDEVEAPAPAPAPQAAAPAPAFTPLAGLARAVEGATEDVMGGQAVPDAVSTAIRRRHGRGRPLASSVAGDLGERLGTDFSGVRVHADAEADTIARSVQAKAFTLGSEIYFSKGTYAPDSSSGRSLLAHELTHVRQHQQGGGTSGGGLSVGTVHDPAEKEAEHVARQVENGGKVPGGSGAPAGGAVRRSPSTTIRRVVGLATVGQAREKEVKTEDGEIPMAFIELFDTVQARNGIQGAIDNGATGTDVWDKTDGFMAGEAPGGTNAALQGVGMLQNFAVGGMNIASGAKDLQSDDSLSRNLGATKIESGTWSLLQGGGGASSMGQSIAKVIGENTPGADMFTNGADAVAKTKKAAEDATASYKLGNQKVKAKREADQFMPYDVRHERFRQFLEDLKADKLLGPLKRDDKKRWPKIRDEWFAQVPQGSATLAAKADETDPAKFNPSNIAHWDKNDMSKMKTEKEDFLKFVQSKGKDFGDGTKARDAYDTRVKGGEAATEEYTDARNMRKFGKFGQVRKADTATTNAIEAAGSTLDAVGTATAAGDMGATKITGKVLKAVSAIYKGVKSLVKRARRVHKLAKSKNAIKYGGEEHRGFLWGMQQFFAGNVSDQQLNAKGAMEDALAKDKKYRDDLAQAAIDQAKWDDDHQKHTDYIEDKRKWDGEKSEYDTALAEYQQETLEWEAAKQEHEERKKAYDEVWNTYITALRKHRADKKDFMSQPGVKQVGPQVGNHLWKQVGGPAPTKPQGQDPGAFATQAPTAPTALRQEPGLVNAPVGLRPDDAELVQGQSKTGKKITVHNPTNNKLTLDAATHKALVKQLTIQCERKIEHMLAALASQNPTVRHRAQAIMHVIAETNLAGAIEKLEPADLDAFADLVKKEKDGTLAPGEDKKLEVKRKAIAGIIKHQLSGIGG